MYLPNCFLMSVLLMIADGFSVKGPSGPLVAPLGSSLILPCYVDELLPVEGLEVAWRRADSETLVHLYQDGESRPESQQQDYRDRAHFFTDQIQHGNFSLHLDNLTAEDEGQYTCRVYSQQDSGESVVEIRNVERLVVSDSGESISVSVDMDVTLSCSVSSHITPEEVSWKKTDENKDILVLLFQNNETLSDSSDERYRDRVEFFTAEIPKGNFSLRLKSVRTEDKGVYMCQVFAGGLSANATVVLERLSFSVSHVMVLILCIAASGSALLLFFIIHYKLQYAIEFSVDSSYYSIFAPMGYSVVLPCYVATSLPKEGLKVEWRRTDSDALVYVYQDGDDESRPENQQQDYHDRAHLFTESMKHGNFSLHLDKMKAEDAGKYTCEVYSKQRSVLSIDVELFVGFRVENNFVPLGDSADLPCFVDKSLLTEDLKVEWRRTDSETLVHLYQDGESRPESQHQDYRDRANFFTDQIQHGNFSLCLDKVTAEDEGQYTCKVYSQQDCVFSSTAKLKMGWLLQGPSAPLVVPLGSSVVLPCYVDKSLLTKNLKVKWRKPDSRSLVHLYNNGEIRSESQPQDYRDRAHFFTEEIQHGNFSLRLDNLRAEDNGQYICTIYNQQDSVKVISTNTDLALRYGMSNPGFLNCWGLAAKEKCVVLYDYTPEVDDELELFKGETIEILKKTKSGWWMGKKNSQKGFFPSNCVKKNDPLNDSFVTKCVRTPGHLHVFLPNIMMFVAFVLWGVTE
ncbi:hypothetical protein QQF64_025528, partial [Cirrhinus molitorella]